MRRRRPKYHRVRSRSRRRFRIPVFFFGAMLVLMCVLVGNRQYDALTSVYSDDSDVPSESSSIAVVPEPSTWILLASGLAAISWQARRKLSQKKKDRVSPVSEPDPIQNHIQI